MKKLIRADFTIGKVLILVKAFFDILIFLIFNPRRKSKRLAHLILQVKPKYSMVSNARLVNLYDLVQQVNWLNLSGDIVECGVWNGGSAAIMGVANEDDVQRKERDMWLFDSFQGLPEPSERDGEAERKSYFKGWNKGDTEKVKEIFDIMGIPLDNVKIIEGWFDSTLGQAPINEISVLHIDADLYDSVKVSLEKLYDKVVPGGFIVFDDYYRWDGCRRAVQEFINERQIEGIEIVNIDGNGMYFQKQM